MPTCEVALRCTDPRAQRDRCEFFEASRLGPERFKEAIERMCEMSAREIDREIIGGNMSEDKVPEAEVERLRSLLGQMSDCCAEIERRKAEYVEMARTDEACRGCGQPPQWTKWVLIPTPGVGLVEKLLCQCEQGHEWYATIPWPEEKKP